MCFHLALEICALRTWQQSKPFDISTLKDSHNLAGVYLKAIFLDNHFIWYMRIPNTLISGGLAVVDVFFLIPAFCEFGFNWFLGTEAFLWEIGLIHLWEQVVIFKWAISQHQIYFCWFAVLHAIVANPSRSTDRLCFTFPLVQCFLSPTPFQLAKRLWAFEWPCLVPMRLILFGN